MQRNQTDEIFSGDTLGERLAAIGRADTRRSEIVDKTGNKVEALARLLALKEPEDLDCGGD